MNVVLIVEDDPDVRETTSILLEDAGYEVLVATDSTQALDVAAHRDDIDVVFTDVNLREPPNGIELVRLLKARGSDASFVVVSGDLGWAGTPLDEDVHFLPKPFGRATLVQTVGEACGRRPSR